MTVRRPDVDDVERRILVDGDVDRHAERVGERPFRLSRDVVDDDARRALRGHRDGLAVCGHAAHGADAERDRERLRLWAASALYRPQLERTRGAVEGDDGGPDPRSRERARLPGWLDETGGG